MHRVTLGQERGLLRTLGQERGLLRTLGQERGLLRTLGRSLVATVVAALAAAGCSDPGAEYCERYCACVDCSEREEDVCLAQRAAESDIAGVFDCDAELEDFESCVVTKETCPGGQFNTDVCNAEAQEYSTCKE